jgi:hypothetical protein
VTNKRRFITLLAHLQSKAESTGQVICYSRSPSQVDIVQYQCHQFSSFCRLSLVRVFLLLSFSFVTMFGTNRCQIPGERCICFNTLEKRRRFIELTNHDPATPVETNLRNGGVEHHNPRHSPNVIIGGLHLAVVFSIAHRSVVSRLRFILRLAQTRERMPS